MSEPKNVLDSCLWANWPAPAHITAFTTQRTGGVSAAPFDSWNLAEHVGDEPESVAQNLASLRDMLPGEAQLNWLEQVHGRRVCQVPAGLQQADGLFTDQALQACCIMTADCVPILLCNTAGDQVGALHAGWRGVAGRIIDHGVRRFSTPVSELMVWIGPSISWPYFRVGIEVIEQLKASISADSDVRSFFREDELSSRHGYANLQAIVEQQCKELGIRQVYQSNNCSYSQADKYFSYRREPCTGRNVSVILFTPS